MKKVVLVALCFLFGVVALTAQTPTAVTVKWQAPATYKVADDFSYSYLTFEGAGTSAQYIKIPVAAHSLPLTGPYNDFDVTITDVTTAPLTPAELKAISPVPANLPDRATATKNILYLKGRPTATFNFPAILKVNGSYVKVLSYQYAITPIVNAAKNAKSTTSFATNSVLASGNWYRIAVTADGIYKLDYNFLNQLGMNVGSINPNNIRIYGNGGGQLPAANATPRIDDLGEIAIEVSGGGDNQFNQGDYILFYGQGQVRWNYSNGQQRFIHTTNNYSDTTYYFITADLGPGKRIGNQASADAAETYTTSIFNERLLHEIDKVNVIRSGQLWFGETFDVIDNYSFSFSIPNRVADSLVNYYSYLGTDSKSGPCSFAIKNGGTSLINGSIPGNVPGGYDEANGAVFKTNFNPGNNSFTINIDKTTNGVKGFLDYIEINAYRNLVMTGGQMGFRSAKGTGAGQVTKYILSNANGARVWDVTDHQNVANQQLNGTSTVDFKLPTDNLREFIAFNGSSYLTPVANGRINNQNLHGTAQVDMIIVAHPLFLSQANRLADFHRTNDNLTVLVTTPQEVYNEFSSGSCDIIAIRSLARMFYKRATSAADQPKYLLLFGDGSYDNKNRIADNGNFIPTYQTEESFNVISSQTSDDYMAVLDDAEGNFAASEAVDIGLGRIPCKSAAEAQAVVDKIMDYEVVNDISLRDWRNMITFIADDEDGGTHMTQADQLAQYIDANYKPFNLEKIFTDSYIQQSTAGGQRYPDAKDAINKRVDRGGLIVNYTGHGGEAGWTSEKILEISDIGNWNNRYALPTFVTATCEFSKFDDPGRTTAGELVLLNPISGGISLFTTTRVVYSGPNFTLNKKFYELFLQKIALGERPAMGDLYQLTKYAMATASIFGDSNSRNFTLLGDPAVRIKYPVNNVVTTMVNSQPIGGPEDADTIRALQLVTIKGEIRNRVTGQKMTSYNGVLYPTIFDKPVQQQTLANDAGSAVIPFSNQRNIIYKGKASIVNGEWSFTFPVPKDIAYQYGLGKISYYAENDVRDDDAHGYQRLIIGGTDTTGFCDNVGPNIRLYMNNTNFANGGNTDTNPTLLVYLADTNGINTVGTGIGHDITAVIDNQNSDPYLLNDYYEADLNSYTNGTVRYPFTNLPVGPHSIRVKAWDICGNSNETTLDFVVANDADLALDHVLNYPNPFTTNTCFMFEHNRPNQVLDVQVQVFTVSGKIVKTINTSINDSGYRTSCIGWDGLDDYGDKIGRGVYIYRVKITDEQGKKADKYEKLVILN